MALVQDLDKCSASRALLTLFFAWNATQRVQKAGNKMKNCDTLCRGTHLPLINKWGVHFDDQTLHIFCIRWTGFRDAF